MTSKGTAAFGKRQKKTHIACRRCGKMTYHIRKKKCSSCGFGEGPKMRIFNWQNKKPTTRKRAPAARKTTPKVRKRTPPNQKRTK